jgi:D-aminoacyl-tRNA deacylase
VRDGTDREALYDALADLLRSKYDEVDRLDGTIVARETAFDPAKARTLGVPEGPKFGRLAAGDPVEVDGREITPEAVESRKTVEFEL